VHVTLRNTFDRPRAPTAVSTSFTRGGRSITRLVVFLYGGGGYWDAATCDPGRSDVYISLTEPARRPARLSGIFALDHPDNPVTGYSM
jgi:hypothetical protein